MRCSLSVIFLLSLICLTGCDKNFNDVFPGMNNAAPATPVPAPIRTTGLPGATNLPTKPVSNPAPITPSGTQAPSATYSSDSPGTYNSAGTASSSGTNSIPTTPPMHDGSRPLTSNSNSPGTYNTGGSSGPSATYNGSTAGNGAGSGTDPMSLNPMSPGHRATRPSFTGKPVTMTTKLLVGDILQFNFNGEWGDVRVMRILPMGFVEVRTQTKPFLTDIVPRNHLQLAPGLDAPFNATKNTARTDTPTPAEADSSASSTGLPSSAGLPKSRPGIPAKPVTSGTPAKEVAKGTSTISLEGASIEELLRIVGNKNEHRRVAATERLAAHPDAGPNPDVAKKLADLLKVEELTVRAGVARALEKWATPEVNDIVLKNVSMGTIEVRESMMRILAANQVKGSAAIIAKYVEDKDYRKLAIESLIVFGEPAEPEVIKMMSHKDSKIRLAACDILKQIGTDAGVAALKKAVDTWTGTDRIDARKALQALEARK